MTSGTGEAPQQRIGSYTIRRQLGRGGMGEVYLAHDEALDRLVAIKVLKAVYANDEDFVRRFQHEARAAARLNHPHITQVHAVHIEARPPYMVMEFVDGVSLDQHVAGGKTVPWGNALFIVRQVASALGAAHAMGVIHRDIKPANIILDKQGRVRVTDFGIAKVLNQATQLTAEQTSVGSPCYMSPEQCGVGEIGPHSDLFSLGITLYELLAGELPFQAETNLGLIRKITSDPLPDLSERFPEMPAILQEFLETLTAKSPQFRYAEARQVVEDLNSMQAGQTPQHLIALRGAAKKAGVIPLIPQNWTTQVNIPQTASDLLADERPSAFTSRRAHQPSRSLWPLVAGGVVVAIAVAMGVALGLSGAHTAPGSTPAAAAAPDDANGVPLPPPPPRKDPPPPQDNPPPPQDGAPPPQFGAQDHDGTQPAFAGQTQPQYEPGAGIPPSPRPGSGQGGFGGPPPRYPLPGTRPGDPGYGPPPPQFQGGHPPPRFGPNGQPLPPPRLLQQGQ